MTSPVSIDPHAFFDDGALRHALGLTHSALAAARRSGALRSSRQGQRILYKGEWVLAWLEADASASEPRPTRKGGAA
jgi:hypothetical protein